MNSTRPVDDERERELAKVERDRTAHTARVALSKHRQLLVSLRQAEAAIIRATATRRAAS